METLASVEVQITSVRLVPVCQWLVVGPRWGWNICCVQDPFPEVILVTSLGMRWELGLVLATCGAWHWKDYEVFCFYPNIGTFCKPGSLFSSEVLWEFRTQSAGSWCLVMLLLSFLLADLWTCLFKQCPSLSHDWMNLRAIWDIQPSCLIESHFLVYWSLTFLTEFEFSFNPPFNVMSNNSFKTQTCDFSLPSNPVKAVGICYVFCTYMQNPLWWRIKVYWWICV